VARALEEIALAQAAIARVFAMDGFDTVLNQNSDDELAVERAETLSNPSRFRPHFVRPIVHLLHDGAGNRGGESFQAEQVFQERACGAVPATRLARPHRRAGIAAPGPARGTATAAVSSKSAQSTPLGLAYQNSKLAARRETSSVVQGIGDRPEARIRKHIIRRGELRRIEEVNGFGAGWSAASPSTAETAATAKR